MKPETLRFAKTHEWLALDGGAATVGISAFAVKELTDVVHIELPKPGKTVKAGDVIGEIESVKAVSDLYSPVSGEIVAVNDALPNELEKLSSDPYGAAWMVKLKVSNPAEADKLLNHADYTAQCGAH